MTNEADQKAAEEAVDRVSNPVGDYAEGLWVDEEDATKLFLAGIAYGRKTQWHKCSEVMPEVGMQILYKIFSQVFLGPVKMFDDKLYVGAHGMYEDDKSLAFIIDPDGHWFEIELPKEGV